nr:MAG TPA: hypothetical protein [Caudoviricetes sp.]
MTTKTSPNCKVFLTSSTTAELLVSSNKNNL